MVSERKKAAVIGAGPIGLHLALRLAQAGAEVCLFERGSKVAASVREWGHVRLFSTWAQNTHPEVVAALKEEGLLPDHDHPFPMDNLPTGKEYVDMYLDKIFLLLQRLPHVQVHLGCSVESIVRDGFFKTDDFSGKERKNRNFSLLLRSGLEESFETADCVVDCSGSWGNNLYMGAGGAPAVGERTCSKVTYKIPDVTGKDKPTYAGKHTLVVGAGHSAITTVMHLLNLKVMEPETRITWITRKEKPFVVMEDDPLPERQKLSMLGNELAAAATGSGAADAVVAHLFECSIQALRRGTGVDDLAVQLRHQATGTTSEVLCDRVIANVGWRPDPSLYSELHVHQCWASDGPIKLAGRLVASEGIGGELLGAEVLLHPEPDFLLLGTKSFGRNSLFILKIGFEQVEHAVELLMPSSKYPDAAAIES